MPNQIDRDGLLREAREICRHRIGLGALAMTVILTMAFLIGRLLLWGRPENGPGQVYMPVMILVSLICFAIVRWLRVGAWHPVILTAPCVCAMSILAGTMLGSLGGLDGPYFYASYLLPTFFIVLPMPLLMRSLGTLASLASFVGAYLVQQPGILGHPMVHIPVIYLVAITSFNLMMGHQMFRRHLERTQLLLESENQKAELSARNRWLQMHSESQIRQAVELSEELTSVQAKERRDIAHELHDDLAQIILAARLQVDALSQETASGGSDSAVAETMNQVLIALDKETRRTIEELRTRARREASLKAIIDRVLREHPLAPEVHCELSFDVENFVLEPEAADFVRSFVKEGVTNAIKHASPGLISISAGKWDEGLFVSVDDDGQGGQEVAGQSEGYGLLGLRERAAELGADLSLTQGRGTRLRIDLPCSPSGRVPGAAQ